MLQQHLAVGPRTEQAENYQLRGRGCDVSSTEEESENEAIVRKRLMIDLARRISLTVKQQPQYHQLERRPSRV